MQTGTRCLTLPCVRWMRGTHAFLERASFAKLGIHRTWLGATGMFPNEVLTSTAGASPASERAARVAIGFVAMELSSPLPQRCETSLKHNQILQSRSAFTPRPSLSADGPSGHNTTLTPELSRLHWRQRELFLFLLQGDRDDCNPLLPCQWLVADWAPLRCNCWNTTFAKCMARKLAGRTKC
jgi:hypothetical protein